MDQRLDQVVNQLTDRMANLINRRRQRHNDGYGTDLSNPFGDSSDSDDEQEGGPREERGDGNRRWESGMRTSIPEFDGDTLNPENFIDWLVVVEEVFEFKEENPNPQEQETEANNEVRQMEEQFDQYSQEIEIEIEIGQGSNPTQLLQNLKQGSKTVEDYTTEFYQLVAQNDIQLVSRYIGGLRLLIMESVNLFDPMTISDAHQRALVFEKQNRRSGGSASSALTGGSSGSGNVASRFVPNQAKPAGGASGSSSKGAGTINMKCFNCGETGHRQAECKRAEKRHLFNEPDGWEDDDEVGETYEDGPVYDEEPEYEEEEVAGDVGLLVVRRSCYTPKASDDDFSEEAVRKLGLKTENHRKPYKLQWLKKGGEVQVSKRTLVSFSVGKTYKDDVLCDVVPMDACHLLLGRPWEYDQCVEHNGRSNTYSFMFDNVKITLLPNKPKEVAAKPTGTLLTLSQFENELEVGDDVFVLIGKEVVDGVNIPDAMVPLLEEFSNVFPDELPDGLPPLRDIQHHIDLEPGSQLPNRPHYRMSPGEHEEL
ncbi:uncharacterized protein LOC110896240 [Helianthus annuus]|uniref:uncharacterized protein LOC110896240 n=1 Tax=Helianthus annuus TaxID=4232 RepID=UPI0016532271|nr:uncharacterized protein LOC110896240 [Helianthus annuus]